MMDKAKRIVKAIVDDFTDRRGLRQEWEQQVKGDAEENKDRLLLDCAWGQSTFGKLVELKQVPLVEHERVKGVLDSVVLQRDAAHKAMLAAERDRDYYLSQIRLRWKGVESSGIGEGCAVACSDGTRWKTVYEWRDAALKAERELEELKAKRPK